MSEFAHLLGGKKATFCSYKAKFLCFATQFVLQAEPRSQSGQGQSSDTK